MKNSFPMWLRLGTLIGLSLLFGTALTAGEALWLRYPTVSPDGAKVAFEYQGDLFVVPLAGGAARQLTSHPARDISPAWSPDGAKIAFSSNRFGNYDVFVVSAEGGTPLRLTTHSADDTVSGWTPDGARVLFTSWRVPPAGYIGFPSGVMEQLYQVDLAGHAPELLLPHGVARAAMAPDGRIAYMDVKGYEDFWRKHQHSSVTRDLWLYKPSDGSHTRLTTFDGEDHDPVWAPDGKSLFYLSEQSGTLNVWRLEVDHPEKPVQLTRLQRHPARFLSASADGQHLVFSWNGELWTCGPAGADAKKIPVEVRRDASANPVVRMPVSGGTEMALSPDGKEVAFVFRGDVFVTAAGYPATRRVTSTPEQERSVAWAPDGRSLYYASERDSSWKIYRISMTREAEKHFYNATLLKEEPVVVTAAETFQPLPSPDGKWLAYIEERNTVKVINLETKETKVLLPADKNYSYSDGDIAYSWSPDSQWLASEYLPYHQWISDVAVIQVATGEVHNVSQSGYGDGSPRWSADGKQLLFLSDRNGLRSHGGHGSQSDVYAVYLTKADHDKFTKPESELEDEQPPDKDKDKKEGEKAEKADADAAKKEKEKVVVKIDFDGIKDRLRRLTLNSSMGMNYVLSPDAKTLVYFANSSGKFDLWSIDLKKKATKLLARLNADGPGALEYAKDGKTVFFTADGKLQKVEVEPGKVEPVAVQAEIEVDTALERANMYEHMWRQVLKKFYVTDLHHVDWTGLKADYARFLPQVTDAEDFAELGCELLGELNASHTGCYYRKSKDVSDDSTAELGLFFDSAWKGPGLKIAEVLPNGPFDLAEAHIQPGEYLIALDGVKVNPGDDLSPRLNRKAGQKMDATLSANPDGKDSRDVVVKPVDGRSLTELLYKRYVKRCREFVDKVSGGRVGYVHVRGMDPESFKTTFSEILGENAEKEALIVDTRFNGGGWLHDDLCTLLGGRVYVHLRPRGQDLGFEPQEKWTRPVAVVTGEANYSDAHMFPFAFRELGLGKIVGMPVPGTGTAVWWERLTDPTLTFGIPQVGVVDNRGKFLENQQLEPDVKVRNDAVALARGEDQQLAAAVQSLLQDLKPKK